VNYYNEIKLKLEEVNEIYKSWMNEYEKKLESIALNSETYDDAARSIGTISKYMENFTTGISTASTYATALGAVEKSFVFENNNVAEDENELAQEQNEVEANEEEMTSEQVGEEQVAEEVNQEQVVELPQVEVEQTIPQQENAQEVVAPETQNVQEEAVSLPTIEQPQTPNAVLESSETPINNEKTFTKSDNNQPKAILVNKSQIDKLNASRDLQTKRAFGDGQTQVPTEVNLASTPEEENYVVTKENLEEMLDKANNLYKEGKTDLAQSIYEQVSKLNDEKPKTM